ncbi:hypothetical protein U8607_18460 [Methylobacterium durans]|uniref:hypothetical protein n=1 Tax=Methylobacterium durans TaxID=2202825 RepID=UPI002AFE194C|nr:hypothetical protein [Methylobacterium durans]MEA1834076.1 hypothetical protein [Methylobacterium durans]
MVLESVSLSFNSYRKEAVKLPSPKLSQRDRLRSLYPYYAGFSEAFVDAALDQLGVGAGSRVLDPWNGSGTTTLVACRRGARATGIDLNPVLAEISVARSARDHSVKVAAEIVDSGIRRARITLEREWGEPLKAIYLFEVELLSPHRGLFGQKQAHALIAVALYSTIRSLSSSTRSRNPTWFKSVPEISCSPSAFIDAFNSALERVFDIQRANAQNIISTPKIFNADFVEWRGRECSYDAIVTSPPYLTRIDYVKATFPELSYRKVREPIDLAMLRNRMLGTPVTAGLTVAIPETIGHEASRALELIKGHPSKASSTYYLRFYAQYFVGLAFSIAKISRLLRSGGGAALVVQTTYYKEILVDLPNIVAEMGMRHGLSLQGIFPFEQKNSINYLNTRSHSSKAQVPPTEAVIIFRK